MEKETKTQWFQNQLMFILRYYIQSPSGPKRRRGKLSVEHLIGWDMIIHMYTVTRICLWACIYRDSMYMYVYE